MAGRIRLLVRLQCPGMLGDVATEPEAATGCPLMPYLEQAAHGRPHVDVQPPLVGGVDDGIRPHQRRHRQANACRTRAEIKFLFMLALSTHLKWSWTMSVLGSDG